MSSSLHPLYAFCRPWWCWGCFAAAMVVAGGVSWAADIDRVVAGIDERIERHRKRDAIVELALPEGKPVPPGTQVSVRLRQHAFFFGSNFFVFGQRNDTAELTYRQRFADVMNLAVLPFYWATYEPQPDETRGERWKQAAVWCQLHGIKTKGHPLVWNWQPDWLRAIPAVESERMFWGRIGREIREFRGLVEMWDVVNEPTEGKRRARERSATALANAYYTYGVDGVVKRAFTIARQANRSASLVLNDYVTNDKYERVIRRALQAGAPIDAIGVQSHMHEGYWGADELWGVCERFSQFGLPIHFTELTVISGRLKDRGDDDWETERTDWPTTASGEARQAEEVREVYRLLFSHPHVEAIVWWDLWDAHAWLGAPGGLLREDLTTKPAYHTIRELVKETWTTEVQTRIDQQSRVEMRGFLGTYQVQIEIEGQSYEGSFEMGTNDSGPIHVQLVPRGEEAG